MASGTVLDTLLVRLVADASGYDRVMRAAELQTVRTMANISQSISMSGLGTKLAATITAPLTAAAGLMAKLAIDARETATKFEVVFEGISASAHKTANELNKFYGFTKRQSQEFLANIANTFQSTGFTRKASLQLSEVLTKLATDWTSFQNIQGGMTRTSNAFLHALLGEREALKLLGIHWSEAEVRQQLLKNRMTGLTFATEHQSKVFANLQLLMQRTKNGMGDFARTIKDPANQLRLLKASALDAAEAFGKVLLPEVAEVIAAARPLVDWIRDLNDAQRGLILRIAGITTVLGPGISILTMFMRPWKWIFNLFKGFGGLGLLAIGKAIGFIGLGFGKTTSAVAANTKAQAANAAQTHKTAAAYQHLKTALGGFTQAISGGAKAAAYGGVAGAGLMGLMGMGIGKGIPAFARGAVAGVRHPLYHGVHQTLAGTAYTLPPQQRSRFRFGEGPGWSLFGARKNTDPLNQLQRYQQLIGRRPTNMMEYGNLQEFSERGHASTPGFFAAPLRRIFLRENANQKVAMHEMGHAVDYMGSGGSRFRPMFRSETGRGVIGRISGELREKARPGYTKQIDAIYQNAKGVADQVKAEIQRRSQAYYRAMEQEDAEARFFKSPHIQETLAALGAVKRQLATMATDDPRRRALIQQKRTLQARTVGRTVARFDSSPIRVGNRVYRGPLNAVPEALYTQAQQARLRKIAVASSGREQFARFFSEQALPVQAVLGQDGPLVSDQMRVAVKKARLMRRRMSRGIIAFGASVASGALNALMAVDRGLESVSAEMQKGGLSVVGAYAAKKAWSGAGNLWRRARVGAGYLYGKATSPFRAKEGPPSPEMYGPPAPGMLRRGMNWLSGTNVGQHWQGSYQKANEAMAGSRLFRLAGGEVLKYGGTGGAKWLGRLTSAVAGTYATGAVGFAGAKTGIAYTAKAFQYAWQKATNVVTVGLRSAFAVTSTAISGSMARAAGMTQRAFAKAGAGIRSAFGGAGRGLGGAVGGVGTLAMLGGGMATGGMAATLEKVALFGMALPALGSVLAGITAVGLALATWPGLILAAGAAFMTLSAEGKKFMDGVLKWAKPVTDTIQGMFGGIVDAIKGDDLELAWKIAMNGIQLTWIRMIKAMGLESNTFVTSLANDVLGGDLGGAWIKLTAGMRTAWESFSLFVVSVTENMVNSVADMWESAVDDIARGILGDKDSKFKQFLDVMAPGLEVAMPWLKDAREKIFGKGGIDDDKKDSIKRGVESKTKGIREQFAGIRQHQEAQDEKVRNEFKALIPADAPGKFAENEAKLAADQEAMRADAMRQRIANLIKPEDVEAQLDPIKEGLEGIYDQAKDPVKLKFKEEGLKAIQAGTQEHFAQLQTWQKRLRLGAEFAPYGQHVTGKRKGSHSLAGFGGGGPGSSAAQQAGIDAMQQQRKAVEEQFRQTNPAQQLEAEEAKLREMGKMMDEAQGVLNNMQDGPHKTMLENQLTALSKKRDDQKRVVAKWAGVPKGDQRTKEEFEDDAAKWWMGQGNPEPVSKMDRAAAVEAYKKKQAPVPLTPVEAALQRWKQKQPGFVGPTEFDNRTPQQIRMAAGQEKRKQSAALRLARMDAKKATQAKKYEVLRLRAANKGPEALAAFDRQQMRMALAGVGARQTMMEEEGRLAAIANGAAPGDVSMKSAYKPVAFDVKSDPAKVQEKMLAVLGKIEKNTGRDPVKLEEAGLQ